MKTIEVGGFTLGGKNPLVLISGPCVIEDESLLLSSAEFLKNLCVKLGIPLVFKSSYDKANRTSKDSFRGPGIDRGLFLLQKVKKEFDLPITTDVHTVEEARTAGEVCDILQIPAFLCRQTDLVAAAAQTGRVVNIKKGQFMAPSGMAPIVDKVRGEGNDRVFLTERGFSFGYNNLVSDMRAIPIMREFAPVCFDATHSVQLPGGHGTSSGGERQFVETLAKSAVAAGADCLFMESHPNPFEAKSDKGCQIPLGEMESLLETLLRLREAVQPEDSHV